MGLSTHILDTARGRPAAGVSISLERQAPGGEWHPAGGGCTDDDGRVKSLLPEGEPLTAGTWRVTFAVAEYFARHGQASFFPSVSIDFTVTAPGEHHHVPLLLSPFGYSTYRGS
jgi:5-hydroxyisourate hydrolase